MLDVKQAAQKASQYFAALYAEHSLSNVRSSRSITSRALESPH